MKRLLKFLTPFRKFGYPVFELGGRKAMDVLLESADKAWNYYSGELNKAGYNASLLAWTISYEMDAYANIYRITGSQTWLERAVSRADYILNVSDMNGDGIPSWGEYNTTSSTERTVWDGMICTALMNLVKLIHGDQMLSTNQSLTVKAEDYLSLVEKVIDRYHDSWIKINDDEGCYLIDPNNKSDTRIIFNQFLALGSAELIVYEVTGDKSYLEKPTAMAKLFKRYLGFNESLRAYTWSYIVGGRAEDLDHGAIDVRFAVLAHKNGIVFNTTDMHYFTHTFTRLLWRGEQGGYPYLNQLVDGTPPDPGESPDQRPFYWVQLADFNSLVWLYSCKVLSNRVESKRDVADRTALLAASELFLHLPAMEQLAADAIAEAYIFLNMLPTNSTLYSEAKAHLDSAVKAYDEGCYEQASAMQENF